MPDDMRSKEQTPHRFGLLRVPLFRLLAINLAAGTALAVLLVGGLLALNPSGLRDLILADRSPGTALGLLLFGFVVTFGSTVMGSAIMATGQREDDEDPSGPSLAGAGTMDAERPVDRTGFGTAENFAAYTVPNSGSRSPASSFSMRPRAVAC